jgi:hypothetical protein
MFVERDGCLPKEEERKRTPPRPTSASPFITQGEVYIFRELEREREPKPLPMFTAIVVCGHHGQGRL